MSDENATLLASSVRDIIESHPVEAGRVRPHRLFDGAGVKVRMLVFDATSIMKEHRSPHPILVQVVSGRVLFRVEGEEHDLTPGSTIHVAGGVLHELEALEISYVQLSILG